MSHSQANVRFDTPPLKNAWNFVSLRHYRVKGRKNWRNLSIDDIYVGRKFNNGRFDDFSNPVKDIFKPVIYYSRQMNPSYLGGKPIQDATYNTYFNDAPDPDWTGGQQTLATPDVPNTPATLPNAVTTSPNTLYGNVLTSGGLVNTTA